MRSGIWRWTAALTATGLLTAWYLWRGGASSFFLALLSWFVMLQGALALWCGPKRMKVVRSWEPDRPVDGDGLAMKLTVTCLSGLPPLWLHVEDELAAEVSVVRNSSRAGKLYFSGFGRVYSGTYHMEEINRGIYENIAVRLTWGDALGWFKRSLRVETEDILIVPPRPLSSYPSQTPEAYGDDEGGGGPYRRQAAAPSAPGRLRPYMAGDPLRRIHWKHSAKTGTLLTRIPEEQGNVPRYLLLGTDEADYALPRGQAHCQRRSAGKDRSAAAPAAWAVEADRFELAVSAAASWLQREARYGKPGELLLSHGGMDGIAELSGYEGLAYGMELLAGVDLSKGLPAEAVLERDWPELSAQGRSVTVITGQLRPGLTEAVLRLAEAGVSAELWCACPPAGAELDDALASRLRQHGVAVFGLTPRHLGLPRKEGAEHASA